MNLELNCHLLLKKYLMEWAESCLFSENPNLTRIGFYSSQEAIFIKQKMTEQIFGNLRAEAESGYFKPQMNIAIAAECVIGAIERLTLTELLTGKRNAEDLASEIVNILLYGLINDNNT